MPNTPALVTERSFITTGSLLMPTVNQIRQVAHRRPVVTFKISVPSQSPSINSFADLTPDSSRRGSASINDFYIDDGFSGLASRTDSKISCESLSVQSGSFPSSLASSAHTSPRHLSPYDAFQNSAVAADNNPRNKDLDSSNNNAAEENESQKEDIMDGNPGQNVETRTISPKKTVTTSLDTNKNPTVIADIIPH